MWRFRFYIVVTTILIPVYLGILLLRLLLGKESHTRLKERAGLGPRLDPTMPVIWCHGASVGEVLTILPVAKTLSETYPAYQILITTGTRTSARLVADKLPPRCSHQMIPVDSPPCMALFFRRIRPRLGLIFESELWPGMLYYARKSGPLLLCNARMSPRSLHHWQRWRKTAHAVLRQFNAILCQSQTDRKHFSLLTDTPCLLTGNLKYDAPPLSCDQAALKAMQQALNGRPVILASSTHPGEEDHLIACTLALKADYPDLLSIIVPRHPHRGREIAALCPPQTAVCRSQDMLPNPSTLFYIADTMGELGLFYRLAGIAFIGGSLIAHGGHNILEAAHLGCVPIVGPHMFNFKDMLALFRQKNAVVVVDDASGLQAVLAHYLATPQSLTQIMVNGKALADSTGGATEKTLHHIAPYL